MQPHRLILSCPKNSNARVFVLRCTCMSEVYRPSPRYYNYDWFAKVTNMDEVIVAWRTHLNQTT